MIQPDRKFVRRLRAQARAAVRTNPVLRRRRRRAPSVWRRHFNWTALRFVVPLFAFIGAYANPDPASQLFFALLWTMCVTLSRAQQIATALHSPAALWFFYQLPVSAPAIFRHQQTSVLRSSLWLGLDWLALTLGFALQYPSFGSWSLVLLAAPVQWATALATALLLVRFWPRLPYGAGIGIGWIALVFGEQLLKNDYFRENIFQPFLLALHWLTPAGWVTLATRAASNGVFIGWLTLAAVGVAAVLALRPLGRFLGQRFDPNAVFGYDSTGADLDPIATSASIVRPSSPEITPSLLPSPRRIPTETDLAKIRDQLALHLAQPAGLSLFSRSWLERAITRLLPLQLRVLCDFYHPGHQLSWGRSWLIALGLLLLARGLQLASFNPVWVGGLTIGTLALFALPIFGGAWSGFNDAGVSARPIAYHAFLPISFWSTCRLILTINALRCLAAFPLVLIGVHQSFTAEPLTWTESLGWGLLVIPTVLSIQPLWIVLRFSKTTNDTSVRWWFTLSFIAAGCSLLLGLAICVGVLAAESLPTTAVVWTGWLLYTHGLLLGYGWAHRRGVFDLIARGQPGQT